MVENGKLKITVLKKTDTKQIFGDNPPMGQVLEACSVFKEGQEFVVKNLEMPEGFCTSAWVSMYGNVRLLGFGGDLPWIKEKGVAVNCCIDGLRPVIFKLERT